MDILRRLGADAGPEPAGARMIVIAWHQPPIRRCSTHARQGLHENAVAGIDIIEDIANDQDVLSGIIHCDVPDPIDHIEARFR
ncbi:hypothetical protein Amme_100_021 [Acidomonas methanolica NBRC 104435]|uniref:Uncharacterized protein n=1 Tax=Acidomonas methanolica NBRC 104435 TaxID=1231351 RepID=A0A023D7C1_ACIMT|nr:hypothetical protein Amme_100_021 [Acidomonas methanolica NBRC 104435]GEK99388.1 hypothetical protein AME01nite_18870 [Acidomonas methanolica NBRC 104435]